MQLLHKLLIIVAAFLMLPTYAMAAEYAVIVNAANGASGQGEIKNLFLKKKTAWDGGAKSVPLSRSAGSPEQEAFNAKVLGMSSSELAAHWQAEKQKTGETPPKEVGSESILFRQVKRKEGAFGVAPASVALPDGVKVLFTF